MSPKWLHVFTARNVVVVVDVDVAVVVARSGQADADSNQVPALRHSAHLASHRHARLHPPGHEAVVLASAGVDAAHRHAADGHPPAVRLRARLSPRPADQVPQQHGAHRPLRLARSAAAVLSLRRNGPGTCRRGDDGSSGG